MLVPGPTATMPRLLSTALLTFASLACVAAPEPARTPEGLLAPGSPMPDFRLPDQNGVLVDSRDLRGRTWLLYWYPKAGTPGCTREACAFRDRWQEVQAAGLTVLGISYDPPAANRAFAAENRLPFRLLSDTDGSLARLLGAWREKPPVPRRISYLVGPDGRVLRVWPAVDPDRHADEVLAAVREPAAAG